MDNTKQYKKIVVIGNGMDIDHKAPTTYSDIFENNEYISSNSEYLVAKVKDIIDDAESDRWTDFENSIRKINRAWKIAFLERNDLGDIHEDEIKVALDLRLETLKMMYEFKFWDKIKDCVKEKEITKIIHIMDEFENYMDLSYALIKVLGLYLQELQKTFHIKKQQKYIEHFEDALVVNYNYTSWYEGLYYSKDDAVYIHGKINNKSNYGAIDPKSEIQSADNILLGYYNDGVDINYRDLDMNFKPSSAKEDVFKKGMWRWLEYIGLTSLHFNKNINTASSTNEYMGFEPIIKRIDSTKINELVFIGHSLSENDLSPLFKKVFNAGVNALCVDKLTIIGYWKTEPDKEETIEKLRKMNLIKWNEIHLINNAD